MELTPSSSVIQAINVVDCDEPMIDLKAQELIAFGPPPETPESEPFYTRMRASVYQRLVRAQSALPAGIRLRLYEGYRSPQVQKRLFEQELVRVREQFPDLSDQDIWAQATRRVSAPARLDGTPVIAPHSTGGAVDVELIDQAGMPLDCGMEIRDWAEVSPRICVADCLQLPSRARQNRALLHGVMCDAGFVDYPVEWWHFSWGDQYWAWRTGRKEARYGQLELDAAGELAAAG